ncbi:MAG: alpha/beta hydrolase [Acidimicrobiia bacterium]|nr:alpha/beta hydrolase [Acidimicrobiia bacterium]
MDSVEVDGLRIAFERAGSGPALVLLHGAVCDSRVWREELDDFSSDYTVVAWEAPGCGSSEDPPESFRLGEYAHCLAGLIEALHLSRPHLLGHSWGSGLALELCRQRPGVAASCSLVGGYAGWAGSLPESEVTRRLEFALHIAELADGEFDPGSMPGLFSSRMPAHRAQELARIMADIRPVGTRAMARAFAEADLRDALGAILVPAVVLCGDEDERSPRSVGEALHAALPRSTLVVLRGLGHEMFLEAPDVVRHAVRSFLRSVDSQT